MFIERSSVRMYDLHSIDDFIVVDKSEVVMSVKVKDPE